MKKLFKTLSTILICLMLSVTTFAHSGRTDSSGGHRDNKNASGLGSYHYHHGYGPHLHSGGMCPYDTPAPPSNASPSPKKSNTTSTTDIKAYINHNFIPSVNYKDQTYIVAEDLASYGFDVAWSNKDRTLKILRNATKETKSIALANPSDTYEIETTDIKTYIYDDKSKSYTLITSYNIGGKTIIKFSSVGEAVWNNKERSSSINM